ncbi:hypothetical protein E1286_45505 [Nonomuraea terrae]|uniref:Uncharacterized protein n=1 Tax=Nonomuraea terrae TaxID=2530383 RepID=A0A4R4XJA5_9ACTN|nr:hypothetical protein [Nonomuraea terrae]TDD30996.1 hypothetical protein E1286_45505 [Nonomuraea terrae]
MYLADRRLREADRYAAGPRAGDLGEPSVLASPADGHPDGTTEDHPRVAVRRGSAVHRYPPDGRFDVVPVPTPSRPADAFRLG